MFFTLITSNIWVYINCVKRNSRYHRKFLKSLLGSTRIVIIQIIKLSELIREYCLLQSKFFLDEKSVDEDRYFVYFIEMCWNSVVNAREFWCTFNTAKSVTLQTTDVYILAFVKTKTNFPAVTFILRLIGFPKNNWQASHSLT